MSLIRAEKLRHGKCAAPGCKLVCTEEELMEFELDHVNPATKNAKLRGHASYTLCHLSKDELKVEFKHLQLLCYVHHKEKSVREQRVRHGSRTMALVHRMKST